MAKKKKSKKARKITFEENLPQNILPMGKRVEEDKNIYISQSVYKEIHKFTKNKLTNESGGMLIGNVIQEFGKTNIVIQGFVEAKYCEATPTTLTFTHETWDYVHAEMEKKYENGQIVGWIHTHPDFGIFLSEYDTFIQQNFFKEDFQIAYVVDPIQHIEGFYFWIHEKIERCKGFYIFDKTGEKIEIEDGQETDKKDDDVSSSTTKPLLTYIVGGVMAVAIVVFAIISRNLMSRMAILEKQQENLVDSANKNISYLQQQIAILTQELSELQNEVRELQLPQNAEETDQTDDASQGDDGNQIPEETQEGENTESSQEESVNE